MPPLWFMPVLFQMRSCSSWANYFIVSERWKPPWDIDGLRCKEGRNPSFIKFWVSWLLPMEETLLLHIPMAQSSEQWQSGLKQLCPGCMGPLEIPDVTYEVPVFLMDPFRHCCASTLQARAGVLSSVCTRTVLLEEFRGSSWRNFFWIFGHMPQTLLLGKWEGQGSICQEWWLLTQKGGARTGHWERWWL